MKTLKESINEQRGMPVLSNDKLKQAWDELKSQLGNRFDTELFKYINHMELNRALWKLSEKTNNPGLFRQQWQ